jgi:RimJ/RimL family protein N-acetyltransferase
VKVEEWNEGYGRKVATWHYEPPYDFYDLASDPEDEAAMHDPGRAANYRAVLADSDGQLDAFWYFDWPDGAVEVGIGLRPDLTGHREGEAFLSAQLAFAVRAWQPATFRLFVAAWNERAIRLYERLGFREVGREARHFELVGDHEFLRMERSA